MGGKVFENCKIIERKSVPDIIEELKRLGFEDHVVKYEICGSYRRGKEKFSDLDVVILPKSTFDNWFTNLQLEKDKGRFGYYLMLKGHQIDFFTSGEDEWWTQVCTWTGSAGFNLELRRHMFNQGYEYNRFGVYKEEKKIVINSEEDIFNLAKLEFFEPWRR